MGAGHLPVALRRGARVLAALLFATAANAGDDLGIFAAEHVASVRSERERAVRDLWGRAGPEQRERALLHLQANRRPGAPWREAATMETLTEVRRLLLDDGDAAGSDPLAALVDSLDLRVVPGAFAARDEGRGEAMTVHVRPLFDARAPDATCAVTLYWLSSGGGEQRARSEPFPTAAIAVGFDMYVRPPLSRAGRWHLVLELEQDGVGRRGLPVPVDCVADLAARAKALQVASLEQPDALRSELWASQARRSDHGLRGADAVPLERWFRSCETDAGGEADPAEAVPQLLRGFDDGEHAFWTFASPLPATARRAYVLLAGSHEHPSDLLTGAFGRAWADLAREEGALLYAASFSFEPEERHDAPGFCDWLRRERGLEETYVVARGQAGAFLMSRMSRMSRLAGAGEQGIDGVVLCSTPATRARPSGTPGLPILSIDDLAPEESRTSGAGAAPWTWVRLREPRFVADLRVPELIGEWRRGLERR